MATVNEKRLERSRLIEELRSMLNKASAGRRELNAVEQTSYTEKCQRVDCLGSEIGGLSSFRGGADLAALETELSRSQGTIVPRPQPGGRDSFGDSSGVRFLRPDEKLADLADDSGMPDGIRAGELSLARAVRGIALHDWSGAEAERRAMGGASDILGGYMVPSPLSAQVIDLARARAVLLAAGASTVVMDSSSLTLAKVTSDLAPGWRPENTALTESDLGFGALVLRSFTLGCLARVSIELLEDAPNAGQVIESALADAMALKLDYAGLLGSGAGEPEGLYYAADVGEVDLGTDGGNLSGFDKFSEACQKVSEANGVATCAILSPRTAFTVDRMKDGEGLPLVGPASWTALRKLVSSQVPITLTHGTSPTCSAAFVGDFSALAIGVRTNLVIEASRVGDATAFSKMQVAIRAYLRADVAILRPSWFVKITGVLN